MQEDELSRVTARSRIAKLTTDQHSKAKSRVTTEGRGELRGCAMKSKAKSGIQN